MAFDTHGASGKPWTGFDLDGTLAVYDKWRGVAHIGKPVKPMCDLLKRLHGKGKAVKILTARVSPRGDGSHILARVFIARWCRDNLGFVPPITHEKDALMETLYDDRVHAVEQNTGKVLNMANTEWEKVYQIKGLPVKFVWRGSPYNDLKATVEGGNRDYVAVARITASNPISQAEAEKLASEKWRQIKATARSRNAVVQKALNARRVARNYVTRKFPDGSFELEGVSGRYRRVKWSDDFSKGNEYYIDISGGLFKCWTTGKYNRNSLVEIVYARGDKNGELVNYTNLLKRLQ